MGHSRPDTTQQYTDDVELDDLADALERAAEARDAQASPDLATLETEIAKGLETLEWRRRESNRETFPTGGAESGLITMREMLDVDGPSAYPRSKDRATFDLRRGAARRARTTSPNDVPRACSNRS
jgi:hypothetical protein